MMQPFIQHAKRAGFLGMAKYSLSALLVAVSLFGFVWLAAGLWVAAGLPL